MRGGVAGGTGHWAAVLDHEDVWCRYEHGGRQHHGEGGEGEQTEPVQNHRGELPLRLDPGGLGVQPDLVRYHAQLPPDSLNRVENMAYSTQEM